MRVSKKTQYGLRALVYLADAFNEGDKVRPLKEISDSQGIPFDYSEKILSQLQEQGLVDAKRGPQGGYFLARSPEQITLAEIMRALEYTTTIVGCLTPEDGSSNSCPKKESCKTVGAWQKIQEVLSSTLESITLADLV